VSDDLIKRLRRTPLYYSNGAVADDITDEAADALEARQNELDASRAEWERLNQLQRPIFQTLKDTVETVDVIAAERDALKEALKRAADMLHSIAGDIEDGHSLEGMRGKYVMAVLSARDNARAALSSPVQKDKEPQA